MIGSLLIEGREGAPLIPLAGNAVCGPDPNATREPIRIMRSYIRNALLPKFEGDPRTLRLQFDAKAHFTSSTRTPRRPKRLGSNR